MSHEERHERRQRILHEWNCSPHTRETLLALAAKHRLGVQYIKSMVFIRSSARKGKLVRNKLVAADYRHRKMTIAELATKYSLADSTIKTILSGMGVSRKRKKKKKKKTYAFAHDERMMERERIVDEWNKGDQTLASFYLLCRTTPYREEYVRQILSGAGHNIPTSRREHQDERNLSLLYEWRQGVSVSDLVKKYDISKQRIHQILISKFEIPTLVRSAATWQKIFNAFANGDTVQELKQQYPQRNIRSRLVKEGFLDTRVSHKKRQYLKNLHRRVLREAKKLQGDPAIVSKIAIATKSDVDQVRSMLIRAGLYQPTSDPVERARRVGLSQKVRWASGTRDFWTEVCGMSWDSAYKRILAMSRKNNIRYPAHGVKNNMLKKLWDQHPDAPPGGIAETAETKQIKVEEDRSRPESITPSQITPDLLDAWSADILGKKK